MPEKNKEVQGQNRPALPMENQCKDCAMVGRVVALEKRLDRAGETHKEFFERIRALEQNNAVQDERYGTILDKLDSLTVTVAEMTAKPARRWENMMDKVLWAVLAAVIAFLLGRVGL